ncbi:MAG: LptE family protein [Bacteroidales bacterium]|nr:LptE family protein [Bacteroidales bacterium]
MGLKVNSLPGFIRKFRQLVLPSLLVMALLGIWLVQGCSYSFTGASISPTVKSISISYLPNNSLLVQPTLSRKLTETIRDKFTNQSNLVLTSKNGDLNIEGEITGYATEPVAISGDQQAQMQRLKITVNIRFTNKQDEKQDFETSFSRYQDYPSIKRLSEVEESLIDLINEELAQDIFNKAVVNW